MITPELIQKLKKIDTKYKGWLLDCQSGVDVVSRTLSSMDAANIENDKGIKRRLDGCAIEIAKLDERVRTVESHHVDVTKHYELKRKEYEALIDGVMLGFKSQLKELAARNDSLNKQNANLKRPYYHPTTPSS